MTDRGIALTATSQSQWREQVIGVARAELAKADAGAASEPWGVRALLQEVDALSARLAQAEQERGEAWDKADFEAEAAEKAEAALRDVETRLRAMELSRDEANHRYDVERRRGDAIRRRLRKYEDDR